MLASESILTVVTAHFGTHGKKFTYISRNWYRLIDKFKWVKFYSTDGLHTELLVRKNSKCQHYYIPVSGGVRWWGGSGPKTDVSGTQQLINSSKGSDYHPGMESRTLHS